MLFSGCGHLTLILAPIIIARKPTRLEMNGRINHMVINSVNYRFQQSNDVLTLRSVVDFDDDDVSHN
jgi:hypothetical protein